MLLYKQAKREQTNKTKQEDKQMTKNNKVFELTQEELDVIATYMNDDIREDVAFDLDSCTPEEFLKEYVSRDDDFEELLRTEFSIEL
jgi:FixJ family two-component response regulator